MTRLSETLLQHGCEVEPQEFRERLAGIFRRLYPTWIQEELSYHPKQQILFCRTVRRELGCKLPSHVILRTLANYRKTGVADLLRQPSRD